MECKKLLKKFGNFWFEINERKIKLKWFGNKTITKLLTKQL